MYDGFHPLRYYIYDRAVLQDFLPKVEQKKRQNQNGLSIIGKAAAESCQIFFLLLL